MSSGSGVLSGSQGAGWYFRRFVITNTGTHSLTLINVTATPSHSHCLGLTDDLRVTGQSSAGLRSEEQRIRMKAVAEEALRRTVAETAAAAPATAATAAAAAVAGLVTITAAGAAATSAAETGAAVAGAAAVAGVLRHRNQNVERTGAQVLPHSISNSFAAGSSRHVVSCSQPSTPSSANLRSGDLHCDSLTAVNAKSVESSVPHVPASGRETALVECSIPGMQLHLLPKMCGVFLQPGQTYVITVALQLDPNSVGSVSKRGDSLLQPGILQQVVLFTFVLPFQYAAMHKGQVR